MKEDPSATVVLCKVAAIVCLLAGFALVFVGVAEGVAPVAGGMVIAGALPVWWMAKVLESLERIAAKGGEKTEKVEAKGAKRAAAGADVPAGVWRID